MDCTQIDRYLDEMMDGTLEADALQAMEEHCQGCDSCAEKLRLNRQMMRVLAEMAPEMDVPLKAQAAWRGAVKREAGKAGRMRAYRMIAGIAAALVVVLGATFMLKAPEKSSGIAFEESMDSYYAADSALIEADGVEAEFYDAADEAPMISMLSKSSGAPMREFHLAVDDVDRVCDYVQDLVLEYEGNVDIQKFDEDGAPCANLYIDLPASNAADFVKAIQHFDQSGTMTEDMDVADMTSMLLVIRSE